MRATRMIMARNSPIRRARTLMCCGSFPARMAMKTMLSMPRPLSRIVRVSRAIHASGCAIHSIDDLPHAPRRAARIRDQERSRSARIAFWT